MAITESQLHELTTAINRWSAALYIPTFGRELFNADVEPEEIDAQYAESDRLGLVWRQLLDDLLADEDLDAAEVARDIHAWGAAEVESARRSAVSTANPGRPLLGDVQLDGETASHVANRRWIDPLVALLEPAPSA